MARKRSGDRPNTFAEMVDAVKGAPAKVVPVRPGRVNRVGVLASPDGTAFVRERESVDSATARELVQTGALVASERCGCGGDYCEPEWVDATDLAALAETQPSRLRGNAPTWIDVWVSRSGRVVFLHGDYEWRPAAQ